MSRFAGFTSRWMMPASCSAPRPAGERAGSSRATPSASTDRPAPMRSARTPPCANSMTRYGRPSSSSPTSCTATTYGLWTRRRSWASRTNRSRVVGSIACSDVEDLDRGVSVERLVEARTRPRRTRRRRAPRAPGSGRSARARRSRGARVGAQRRSATSRQSTISESITLWSRSPAVTQRSSSRRGTLVDDGALGDVLGVGVGRAPTRPASHRAPPRRCSPGRRV